MGELLIRSFLDGLRPEPLLTVTEWAELHKKLDSKGSAEPGPYRVSRTPPMRKIQDCMSFCSQVITIILMKGVQLGFTEAAFNFLGYMIDCVPGPMMYVMPTVETMQRNVKQRIDPMIDNCPRLVAKVGKKRSKDGGNTLHQKDGPGFVLIMTGANSAAGLRSVAVRGFVGDEIDAWPGDVEGEGSPLALVQNRQVTFGDNKKEIIGSTPTIEGESKIESEFQLTDQQYYHVPCVHCNKLQVLEFEQLKWDKGKYDDVHYECIHCKGKMYNRHKTWFLRDEKMGGTATWIAARPDLANAKKVGFHLNSLYSPEGWLSWEGVAEKWDKAENDEPERKAFINTILAKTYKVKGDAPPWQQLFERSEAAGLERNVVWESVAFITAGVDVQADRLEIDIVGWMQGRISQQIDYRVIVGDTAKLDVWDQLGELLDESWDLSPTLSKGEGGVNPHFSFSKGEGGVAQGRTLSIRVMAVDTGYNTSKVHDFVRKHTTRRVVPIKGNAKLEMPFMAPKVVNRTKQGKPTGRVKVWSVGVSYLKMQLYGWLRLTVPLDGDNAGVVPPGYCHFLPNESYYFRGMTAEELVPVRSSKTNAITYEWVKRYVRNEPLDCRVYALAAAYTLGFDRWDEARWRKETPNTAAPLPRKAVQAPAASMEAKPNKKTGKKRRGDADEAKHGRDEEAKKEKKRFWKRG